MVIQIACCPWIRKKKRTRVGLKTPEKSEHRTKGGDGGLHHEHKTKNEADTK